ncbi:OLC1v1005725C1 [Oldenlandia corymbosa var. corymbosa]|uniref:OLC1v1005725C1 n=1 Tax=Oldenlandia corymbosa var. corymbosa TaxID=529605 RepID=A0AAV1DF94_OLDCO|nr:OLC1v1005725C1 [Oldenlandia corymbosa var. corymbosa]
MPDDSFVIDHKLLYNDLVGLICERVGWNRKNVNLNLSILYDTMRNGFRRIAKIKDDASLQVLYFLPSSTYIDLYVDLEVAGTSRSHLEVGTTSGRPNVENVDYMEDDDVGGPFMEDGDHMEYNHGEDDEDYTSISDQSDENQSISEGSRESDEEVEDKFATKDRHIYRSQGTWDHTKVDKDDFQLTMWDGTTATIGIGTCFKNKEEAKSGIAAWNIEQKREFYVKESDGSTWSIWCKSLKESTPKGYVPCRWKVELDPDYEVKVVQEEVKDRMHVDVPYHRAWEGRRKAIDLVYGDWVSNFDILPSNLVAQFRSKKIKRLCWEMGTKLSKSKFKELRNELRDFSNDAYLYLEEVDACQWTLAKDKHYRWGNQITNISESYNNVLKGVRFLPIRALVEATFVKTVDLFQEEYVKSRKCITPVPTDLWEDFKKKEKKTAQHKVNRYGAINGKFKLWVWERIPRLQPKRKVKDESYLVPDAPLGNRWKCPKSKANIAAHCVAGIMDQLSSLRDGDHVVPHELGDPELGPQCTSNYMPWFQKKTIRFMTDLTQYGPLAQGYHSSSSLERFYSSNLSDIYHLADAALRENPSLGGSLEDKLFQIFDKSFSALTLGPRDMSTQFDTQVLQKRPHESSQNVVLTQKTTSKPTGGGRRKRPEISDRTIIVHPNPTPMQEDDENDEGNESDEDYYIRGEEEEEESSPPRVSSQKKKKTVEVRKSDRVSKPAKKYTPGDGATRKKRSSK